VRFPRIAASIVLSSLALGAQSVGITTGDLKGRVRVSGTQEVASGVQLKLENLATGEIRTAELNGQGEYRFRILAAGTYTLTAEAPGLALRRIRDIQVLIGTVSVLDIDLAREAEGSMDVVAEAPGLDPQRTQVSTVIDSMLLDNLPINRRTFEDFSLTVPGVARSNMPLTGAVPSSGLTFRGANSRQNRFLVDGLDNNDLGSGAVACPVSQGAVREFQVISGAFSAEYGRATGGIVNSLLRSGGNEVEGSAFFFYRPGTWDAHSADGSDSDDFHQEQFGATVAGPVIKDKLFYFASVERYQKHDVNVVSIDPAVLASPSFVAGGFHAENGSVPFKEEESSALVKFDYLPDDRNKWGLRLSYGDGSNENQIPWGGLTAESAGGTLDKQNVQLALSHQWLGSERWVNEARALFARQDAQLKSMDPFRTVSVDITGVAQFGSQRLTPQETDTDYLQFTDTATFFSGDHTLKVGVDVLQSRNRGTVEQNTAGVYVFSELPGFVPDSLTAFNVGVPAAYVQSWGDPSTEFNARSDALFLQDDWQISPQFLLKLGLRFDHEDLPEFDQSAYGDLHTPPATVDPVLGPTRLPDGEHPYSQLFATNSDWSSSRLSPRAAFSWQAKEPLRIFGGYGVFSGSTQLGSLFGPRLYNNRNTQTSLYTFLDDVPRILTAQPPMLPAYWGTGPAQAAPPAGTKPVLVIPGSYSMPETKAWNLGMEWVAGPSHRFTLDLLYSRGDGFMNVRDVNAYVTDPATGLPRRPDLRYSQVLRVDGSGESRYWGQTVGWQWRVNDDVALGISYTHGKAEDNYTDWNPDYPPQNTYDPDDEWGLSSEDQTHQIQLSGVFRSRFTHPFLRAWTVGVIAQYASGRPYSKLVGYDQDLNGDGSADRPEGTDRNSERGPDLKNVDLRLAKEIKLAKGRMEFLVEVFNVLNNTNVLKVQNVLSAPAPHAYGTPLEYGPKRQVQLGLKVSF
jgi:hypothetical protein